MTHCCVEQDRCWHKLVEFEHHFVLEVWHVKDESDRARAFPKIGKVHIIEMGDFGGGSSESQMLGRGLDVVQKIFHNVLMNDVQWKTVLMNSLDQFIDPFVFINERAQVVSQVNLDEQHVVQGQILDLEQNLLSSLSMFAELILVQELSFLVTLFDVLVNLDLVHGSKDGSNDSGDDQLESGTQPGCPMVPHESVSGGGDECGDCWEPILVLLGRFVHGPQLVLHSCGVLLMFGNIKLEPDVHPAHAHGIVSDWLEHHILGLRLANDLLDFSFPDIRKSD